LGDRQVAGRDQTVIGTSDLRLRYAPVPPTEYNYFAKNNAIKRGQQNKELGKSVAKQSFIGRTGIEQILGGGRNN
jgi:hypothetical protein